MSVAGTEGGGPVASGAGRGKPRPYSPARVPPRVPVLHRPGEMDTHIGFKVFVLELMHEGVTAEEIDVMARQNPARLLDLT